MILQRTLAYLIQPYFDYLVIKLRIRSDRSQDEIKIYCSTWKIETLIFDLYIIYLFRTFVKSPWGFSGIRTERLMAFCSDSKKSPTTQKLTLTTSNFTTSKKCYLCMIKPRVST